MSGTNTFKERSFVGVKTTGHTFGYLFGKPLCLIVKFKNWQVKHNKIFLLVIQQTVNYNHKTTNTDSKRNAALFTRILC